MSLGSGRLSAAEDVSICSGGASVCSHFGARSSHPASRNFARASYSRDRASTSFGLQLRTMLSSVLVRVWMRLRCGEATEPR